MRVCSGLQRPGHGPRGGPPAVSVAVVELAAARNSRFQLSVAAGSAAVGVTRHTCVLCAAAGRWEGHGDALRDTAATARPCCPGTSQIGSYCLRHGRRFCAACCVLCAHCAHHGSLRPVQPARGQARQRANVATASSGDGAGPPALKTNGSCAQDERRSAGGRRELERAEQW